MSKIYATITMKVVLLGVDAENFDVDDFCGNLNLRHVDEDMDSAIEILETDVDVTDSK